MAPIADESDVLARRLTAIANLSSEELEAVRALPLQLHEFPARHDIVREGDRPSRSCLLLSGFAMRYKLAVQGGRQILSFHVAGDIPDLQSLHLPALDHTFATLSPVRAAFVRHSDLNELIERFPRVGGALWRETLITAAMHREWILGLGQREALSRAAHLLCELFVRLKAVGLVRERSVELPITQVELADALGVSSVHANRVIQELRARGLILLRGRSLVIARRTELEELAGFDPGYLHLEGSGAPDGR